MCLIGQVFGFTIFALKETSEPTGAACEMVAALSQQLVLALELIRLAAEAQQAALAQEHQQAAQERVRIARDQLATTNKFAETVRRRRDQGDSPSDSKLRQDAARSGVLMRLLLLRNWPDTRGWRFHGCSARGCRTARSLFKPLHGFSPRIVDAALARRS